MNRLETRITEDVEEAAACIRQGGLVSFPTETVFGIGADALNALAVQKIFQAKGRPADNPLIVHVSDPEQVHFFVSRLPEMATVLMHAFFPGPLTLVLPKSPTVPDITTAGLDTVAVRMPDHALARALISAARMGIAAPSANRSGRPSPTTWEDVLEDLDGRIDLILKGTPTRIGLESTVVDCTGKRPLILRPGGVTLDDLRLVLPDTDYAANPEDEGRSPGTRHRHYQPRATVKLVQAGDALPDLERAAFIGLNGGEGARLRRIVADIPNYARDVFSFFRECEKAGIGLIYCQHVPKEGLGRALMDRLQRAVGEDPATTA